jgi:hypothetical protein
MRLWNPAADPANVVRGVTAVASRTMPDHKSVPPLFSVVGYWRLMEVMADPGELPSVRGNAGQTAYLSATTVHGTPFHPDRASQNRRRPVPRLFNRALHHHSSFDHQL